MLRCHVTDNGVGIPEDRQPHLFQAFVQAESSTSRKYGGTGLGLAICKLLVGLMGGHMGLQSVAGQGSTFYFLCRVGVPPQGPPPADPSLLDPPEEEQEEEGGLQDIRVLVAEDNKVNQLVAMRMLRNLGIQCDIVDDGAQAVKAVAEKTYDLVLMDCHMPVVDGYEATRMIRQEEAKYRSSLSSPGRSLPASPRSPHPTNRRHGFGRHTCIVALTASALSGDREKCLAAGMDSFLSKPIRPSDLQDVIHKHLSHLVDRKNGSQSGTPPLLSLPKSQTLKSHLKLRYQAKNATLGSSPLQSSSSSQNESESKPSLGRLCPPSQGLSRLGSRCSSSPCMAITESESAELTRRTAALAAAASEVEVGAPLRRHRHRRGNSWGALTEQLIPPAVETS